MARPRKDQEVVTVKEQLPEGFVVLTNTAETKFNVVHNHRIWELEGGESALFPREIADFLKGIMPFLLIGEMTDKQLDNIAEAVSKECPYTGVKPNPKSTFDPLDDKEEYPGISYYGDGMADDIPD